MPPLPNDCRKPTADGWAVDRLNDILTRHHMIVPGDSVLVAVSGGSDSVAMVHLLHRVAPRWELSLAVAHVNHGLQPDAAEAADFVTRLAGTLGLACHHLTRDVADFGRHHGMSVETAGRAVRYGFFSDLCISHGYQRVAVGHHRDDCAEQMLMNLARGSGPSGLTGIAPTRDKWVIRPLIDFSRKDILTYLSAVRRPYRVDASNTDRRMTRNRIRHDILPVLAEHVNAQVVSALARTAEIINAENTWIDGLAAEQLTAATLNHGASSMTLSATALAACPLALQRRMVRVAIGQIKGDTQGISHGHVDAVVALARQQGGSGGRHLPGRIQVSRQYDRLILRRCPSSMRTCPPADKRGAPYRFELTEPRPGASCTLQIDDGGRGAGIALWETGPEALGRGYSAGHCVAFFDMEKLLFPLILRSVRHGDRFQPLGMAGSQKVYKLLKDQKIAPGRRSSTPVLVSGGDIIWVPGVKMGHPAAVTADTRRVIRADFILPWPD